MLVRLPLLRNQAGEHPVHDWTGATSRYVDLRL